MLPKCKVLPFTLFPKCKHYHSPYFLNVMYYPHLGSRVNGSTLHLGSRVNGSTLHLGSRINGSTLHLGSRVNGSTLHLN
jgi:hypothetical protein